LKPDLPELIDGLLIKVILREASEDETRQVEQWVSSGDANRLYFQHFKKNTKPFYSQLPYSSF